MSKFNKKAYDNYLASKEANENKVKEARAFMSRHKLSWFEDEAQKIMEDMPEGMSPVELTSSSHWVDRHGLSKAGCIPVPVGLNEVEQAVVDGMWAFLGYEPQEGIMPLLGHANAAAAFAAVGICEKKMATGFITSVLIIGRDGGLYWICSCPCQGDEEWEGLGIRSALAK